MKTTVALLGLLLPQVALADQNYDENSMFGGENPPPAEAVPPGEAPPAEGTPATGDPASREEGVFGAGAAAFTQSEDAAPSDPLTLGGMVYLRYLTNIYAPPDVPADYTEFDAEVDGQEGTLYQPYPGAEVLISMPMLLDLYADARPGDRVRAFAAFRVVDNPLPANNTFSTSTTTYPTFTLTTLWAKFDLDRKVYVTAGKQFVKWGTARFWNPTDFLQPTRKDPLEPFDVRTGVNMVRLHLPWEKKGWNFYAVALMDDTTVPIPTSEQVEAANNGTTAEAPDLGYPDNIGGAARAEIVLGNAEFGLDGILQQNRHPRVGLDLSAGVGPVDVYGEVVFKEGSDKPLWKEVDPTAEDPDDQYEAYEPEGFTPAATAGLSWSRVINDNDTLILGAEYAWSSTGYEDNSLYPWLLLNGAYSPFYLGRHYGAGFAALSSPGKIDELSLTFSTLANLTDKSALSRLDVSYLLHNHLSTELYGAVHYGEPGGEFTLQADVPFSWISPFPTGPDRLVLQQPRFDFGISLRLDI